ncbi:hypothetical protein BC829DRAFT_279243 [Chytridium lagenaria]|nr:hypothetical protein BC829DRAFT_279243 [Chytridium lagenaria]
MMLSNNMMRQRSWTDGQSYIHTPADRQQSLNSESTNQECRGSTEGKNGIRFARTITANRTGPERSPDSATSRDSNSSRLNTAGRLEKAFQLSQEGSVPTRYTILVVDDSVVNRSVLVRMLEKTTQAFDIGGVKQWCRRDNSLFLKKSCTHFNGFGNAGNGRSGMCRSSSVLRAYRPHCRGDSQFNANRRKFKASWY